MVTGLPVNKSYGVFGSGSLANFGNNYVIIVFSLLFRMMDLQVYSGYYLALRTDKA